MEYQLTNQYNVTHGHGMAIIDYAWMNHILNDQTLPAFEEYARKIFGISEKDPLTAARAALDQTKKVYEDMGLTLTLRSIGAKDRTDIPGMARQAVEEFGLTTGTSLSLTVEDVEAIYNFCF